MCALDVVPRYADMNALSSWKNNLVRETEHLLHIKHGKHDKKQSLNHTKKHHPTKVTTKVAPENDDFVKGHRKVLSLAVLAACNCENDPVRVSNKSIPTTTVDIL